MVITSTPADAFGETGNADIGVQKDDPIVFVVDLVSATKALKTAEGKAVAPKAGLPTVTMNEGKPATIAIPKGAKAPTKTIVQPLIEGTGPEVKKGQTVRVAYTGALWKDGSVFDSSANRPEQPYFDFPIAQGQVIKGWDNGLVGPEGRQPRAARHPAGRRLRHRRQPAEDRRHRHPGVRRRHPRRVLTRTHPPHRNPSPLLEVVR